MRGTLLGIVLLLLTAAGNAGESFIRADSPKHYKVKKGDTLWDISGRFLKSPWLWKEVWHANPHIFNPDLIYPGDRVSLIYIDGKPRLTLSDRGEQGRTVKLAPQIRITPSETAVDELPLDIVDSFLTDTRIATSRTALGNAPQVVDFMRGHLISGSGDLLYVRGSEEQFKSRMAVVRFGELIVDPDSEEELGVTIYHVADVALKHFTDGVASMRVLGSNREIRRGDRLLPTEHFAPVTSFFPKPPETTVSGKIVAIVGDVSKAGQLSNVVVNRGLADKLQQGDTLFVYRQRRTLKPGSNEAVTLPSEKVGVAMVYRTFEELSYAILLSASEDIESGDLVKSP